MDFDQLSPQMRGAKTRLLNQLEKRLKISALQMEARSKQITFSRFNNQTGRLRQSIAGRFSVIDGKPTAILQAGGQFGGAELGYARFVEFGTRYIKPRKFLGRSVKKQQQEIRPKLNDLLRTALLGD
tara:strand:+ start:2260 stop:2640 length:381 start_codon:yes stop_codon:yes gene_type:complete